MYCLTENVSKYLYSVVVDDELPKKNTNVSREKVLYK